MEEKVNEVEMMYIQNTSGTNYSVELTGRRCKTTKLNFSHVEGVEFCLPRPLEVKHSYLQMAEGQNKMWSLKFVYPTNFIIKSVLNKISIEIA
jgi:hypothetical protein